MKTQSKVILAMLVTALSFLSFERYEDHKKLTSVQNGDKTLVCHLSSGVKEIDGSLVRKYDPEFGWIFTSGSAKNCQLN